MARQVDRQRGHAQTHNHGVPGVRVLSAAVQEYHPRSCLAPLQGADVARVDAMHRGQWTGGAGLIGVLGQQRELGQTQQIVVGDVGHVSTLRAKQRLWAGRPDRCDVGHVTPAQVY